MSRIHIGIIALMLVVGVAGAAHAKGDDFNSVVKMIGQFYGVKHEGLPFLAKAGMKIGRTAAKIKGGTAKRLAEAGTIKLAVFENQNFAGETPKFRSALNAALNETWLPLVQTFSAANEEQTYIFLRESGDKYHVLVITIEQRDATVVQVTLSPENLKRLLKDPEGTGKAITDEATIVDQE